ncbi:MAG: histidine phosphatase family protein [Xanthomonadaceae bacterium]|nr:histidine phosphatase family protein [Xanthomonadaceae bacterium]
MNSASRGGQRRLMLIRHAQAADPEPGVADRERALTPHGMAQCTALREWLRARLDGADALALISPATRAVQTSREILSMGFCGISRIEPLLWNASPATLLDLIDENPASLLLIGHNPGLEQVQYALTGTLRPLPTAAAFDLDLENPRRGRLTDCFQPGSDGLRIDSR